MWGEKIGESFTFTEYLVKRAEKYMIEPLDRHGKTKEQEGYSWRKYSTRITYLIEKYLQSSIERAMQDAMAVANKSIAVGLEQAVKDAIKEVGDKLTVKVHTK